MAIAKHEIKPMQELKAQTIEKVLLQGDVAGLSSGEKVVYINKLCEALELNPLTKPFQIIKFQNKEMLYATKDCTEQLRKKHQVSLSIVETRVIDEIYIVTARAVLPDGRTDESTGAVSLPSTVKGDMRANAIMKAETKAKRRVTLSICGLGMLDESELDTMPNIRHINIEAEKEEGSADTLMLEKIQTAENLDVLKKIWELAQDYCRDKNDKQLLNQFAAAKDQRKAYLSKLPPPSQPLDAEAQQFIDEMDQTPEFK